jgi:anthranilate phosphoribosyltransferase
VVSESRQVDPESMDFSRYHLDELKGGDKDFNARLIKNILENRSTDAQRDIVLLNAIFAIHVSGKAETLQEARKMAEESLFSGKALDALNRFAQATQSVESDS